MALFTRSRRTSEQGFTLLEMIIAVLLFGIVSMSLSPTFKTFMTAKDLAYTERQTLINNKLAAAFTNYATDASAGSLPLPYTNSTNKFFYAPINPTLTGANTTTMFAQQQGLTASDFNDDGTANARVRVYQRATGLAQDTFFYFQGGPPVSLSYDLGVLYMTACSRTATCNSSATTPTTQTSPTPTKLTVSNYTTWTPPSDATSVVYVSTLPIQKQMLQTTAQRFDALRTAFTNYFTAKGVYPGPISTAHAYDATASVQGCYDGWYALDQGSVSTEILQQIGFTRVEDGRTAWGATIEYCADYDPLRTKGLGNAPHYAALRANKFLSLGYSPDYGVSDNNVVVSF